MYGARKIISCHMLLLWLGQLSTGFRENQTLETQIKPDLENETEKALNQIAN